MEHTDKKPTHVVASSLRRLKTLKIRSAKHYVDSNPWLTLKETNQRTFCLALGKHHHTGFSIFKTDGQPTCLHKARGQNNAKRITPCAMGDGFSFDGLVRMRPLRGGRRSRGEGVGGKLQFTELSKGWTVPGQMGSGCAGIMEVLARFGFHFQIRFSKTQISKN